jgi:BTG family
MRYGRCGVDNNELRGHMIPVPVFGFCHCSPERRFCLVVVNHLNNVRWSLSPSTSLVYKYPPRRPNHTLHPFRVLPPSYPFVFGFLFQASVSLGQSYPSLLSRYCSDAQLPQISSPPNLLRTSSRTPSRFSFRYSDRRSIHVSHAPSRISDFLSFRFYPHVNVQMSSSTTTLSSISVTVSHAIAYITRPLTAFMSEPTILKLQVALESNLTAHYAQSWVPSQPLRGSGRRCLTFSPHSVPPRPIYAACMAAKVQWSEWMTALGNIQFDLIVDPGLVSVRFIEPRSTTKLIMVWSDEAAAEEPRAKFANTLANSSLQAQQPVQAVVRSTPKFALPTLAQQLQIDDEEDEEELFAALADELRRPTWTTPTVNRFPSTIPQKSVSPASSGSHHSRSSSLSSTSDAGSWVSFDSEDSDSSVTTMSSAGTEGSKLSRRERVRPAFVFIDNSKKEVTNYDGGKTTVLTGGVMLGARPVAAKPATPQPGYTKASAASSSNWRSARA